jgi:hypothetical protein
MRLAHPGAPVAAAGVWVNLRRIVLPAAAGVKHQLFAGRRKAAAHPAGASAPA